MNPTRLFVLGALARRGPMYGHQLRRGARLDRAELWSEVRRDRCTARCTGSPPRA
jgi:hypothetical protein